MFFLKTLLPLRHPSPSHCICCTLMRKHPSTGPLPSREVVDGLTPSLLQNWVRGPNTGYGISNDREDLAQAEVKVRNQIQTIFQEFPDKIQDMSTDALQTYLWESLQLEQILVGFGRTGERLNPESQVTPAQVGFRFLLQNKTKVKRNQNGNEIYLVPLGTYYCYHKRRVFSWGGFLWLNQIHFFKTEKRRLPYYTGSLSIFFNDYNGSPSVMCLLKKKK